MIQHDDKSDMQRAMQTRSKRRSRETRAKTSPEGRLEAKSDEEDKASKKDTVYIFYGRFVAFYKSTYESSWTSTSGSNTRLGVC
jgi:hypothetical protein